MEIFREFMTTWHTSPRPYFLTWSTRNKANTMESTTSTDFVPYFRPFDLLAEPNQALTLLVNVDQRIGVESVCGAQPYFRRHVDFDTVYFQFAGTTTIETEFGEYVMKPGEIMLVPEGIAHRSTGTVDSLRWFAFVNEPFTKFAEERYTGETEFEVIRHNGPQWSIPAGREVAQKGGIVEERMICWDHDEKSMTVAKRDYDFLIKGASTDAAEQLSGIRKLRAFDMFEKIAGKTGGAPPSIFMSRHCRMETFNISGEQFAYHRALRSEELRFQFRGEAYDLSELENVHITPGGVTLIPRGISHGLITDPPDSPHFLRFNILSDIRWSYPYDLTRNAFNSTFETKTVVRQEAAWRTEAGLVVPSVAGV